MFNLCIFFLFHNNAGMIIPQKQNLLLPKNDDDNTLFLGSEGPKLLLSIAVNLTSTCNWWFPTWHEKKAPKSTFAFVCVFCTLHYWSSVGKNNPSISGQLEQQIVPDG